MKADLVALEKSALAGALKKLDQLFRAQQVREYIGLAENKRKADCTRLIEVLQGQRGHEKEVKLEIVVHL
jgi:hypothetical protein